MPSHPQACSQGQALFQQWEQSRTVRLLGAFAKSSRNPDWRAYTAHLAACPMCDRRKSRQSSEQRMSTVSA